MSHTVNQMREGFAMAWKTWEEAGRPALSMLELIGASFIADEPTIFGAVNEDYVKREIEWYDLKSPYVEHIRDGAPKIWREIADVYGRVNSNYGYLLYHHRNGNQYHNVYEKLINDKGSRQAVAIYTRPFMHYDWNIDGKADFVCTNAVQYLIRDNKLHVVVQMRSNDAVFGYRNDYAWQAEVQSRLLYDLQLEYPDLGPGQITWQAGSIHIYPRHFHLVEEYIKTGVFDAQL